MEHSKRGDLDSICFSTGVGIFRLHQAAGFADGLILLKMTGGEWLCSVIRKLAAAHFYCGTVTCIAVECAVPFHEVAVTVTV